MRALASEWYKFRKSGSLWALLAAPLMGFGGGLISGLDMLEGININQWYTPLFGAYLVYGLLFLPLITGVWAGLVCRYEHQAGGWKQLLAAPVTRGQVFVAKYAVIMLLVLVMQLLYLAALYAAGRVQEITDPFPLDIVWKSIFGGWVAVFPLAALQLWMSMMWKSFAAPFAVNVIFTLPSILVVNSERFGPYYPWSQPFSMMYIGGSTDDVFFIPWEQLLTVVGGSFVLFFLAGYIYFQRKSV